MLIQNCQFNIVCWFWGFLNRLVEEIGLRSMEHSSVLMPVLLNYLNDDDPVVARQSIVSGSNLFCSVLEEMALQVSLSSSHRLYPTYVHVMSGLNT